MYFITAQKGRNEWWRYIIGFLAAMSGNLIVGFILISLVLGIKISQGTNIDLEAFQKTYDPELLGLSQNSGLILFLLPSVFAFFILWLIIIKLHNKKTGDIASSEGRIRWSRLITGAFIWLSLMIAAELIFASIYPDNYSYRFSLEKFIPLLIIAILFIPFQTWFEELLFRSYLMQGLGLLFRFRFVALLLTALGFGLLHNFNPEVKEFGFMATMPYYVGFGIFAGLLVIMDNGIELAFAVHAANNIYGAIFVTYESSVLKTPALWTINKIDPWQLNLAFLIMACVFILIMSKLYSWNHWKRIFTLIPKVDK